MEVTKAKRLALDLMKKHGVGDWHFKFTNAKQIFGICSHHKKVIGLSKPITALNSFEQVKDTILHEIAHALAPETENHGAKWKEIAKSIGCDGTRCGEDFETVNDYKLIGYCSYCGYSKLTHRRRKVACGRCCNGKFNKRYLLKYKNIDGKDSVIFQFDGGRNMIISLR